MQATSLLRDLGSLLPIHYKYKGPRLFSSSLEKQCVPVSLSLPRKQQFLPVSLSHSRKKLLVSCCAKKTDEAKIYIREEDVEVLPKPTGDNVSTDKGKDVDQFGVFWKAVQKAILTNSAVYDSISKAFGPVVAWVLPFIPAVLTNLLPKKIFLKRSEKISSKLFAVGDLITFPYEGVQVVGIVKDVRELITLVRLRRGGVQFKSDKWETSLIYNITSVDDKGQIMWAINIDVECSDSSDPHEMVKKIKVILDSCLLMKSNSRYNRVILDSCSVPKIIMIMCNVQKLELKDDPFLSYLDLRYALLNSIGELGKICT